MDRVQIQILLHFLKLSLPGPIPPATPDLASPKKPKRSSRSEPKAVIPSTEDCLESFMDKLSMWQLMNGLDPALRRPAVKNGQLDERDWMQVFCEDLVELQYVQFIFRNAIIPSSFSLSISSCLNDPRLTQIQIQTPRYLCGASHQNIPQFTFLRRLLFSLLLPLPIPRRP